MPQVNGDNLLHQQIVKRTIEALQAKDEAFAIEYGDSIVLSKYLTEFGFTHKVLFGELRDGHGFQKSLIYLSPDPK